MKKQQLIFIFLSIFISVSSFAQVLISDKEVKELNSSAILQLDSTEKGFLMPRMTNDKRLAIDTPAPGLQVYVIDFEGSRGIVMFYNGKEWKALTKIISGPSAPIGVQATISNGEAIVTFGTPDNDGGSTITQYTATSDPGELSNTIEATEGRSITISGLDANTFYTFTVTATNEVDTGLSSESSNVVPGPEVGDTLFEGKVFYILTTVDPGYVYGETHGLICAPNDLGGLYKWSPDGAQQVTGTDYRMASGKTNTEKIIAAQLGEDNNYAAYQATLYNAGDGYTGWYLPSEHEVNRIYLNLKNYTNMQFQQDGHYWSSYEDNKDNALAIQFSGNSNGIRHVKSKNNEYYVRPIRSF
jgi:hypothetical protein